MQPYSLSIPLAPVLILQGKYARSSTPKLPEAEGDRCGVQGKGDDLRLLVLGDSAAAGVGASTQERALVGELARQMSSHHRVIWRLHARTGNTTLDTLQGLATLEEVCFDVVVVSTGVNDVTGGVDISKWRGQLRHLHQQLRERYGAKLVIYSGVPPMGRFLALPQPLRFFMGQRARLFDEQLQQTVAGLKGAAYVAIEQDLDDRALADDGFHPSEYAYQHWGEALSLRLKSALLAMQVETALEEDV